MITPGRHGGPVLPPSLQLLRAHSDWRRSWSHVVASAFSTSSPYSGLLFYSQDEGAAEFYETDGAGGIALLSSQTWRTSWTHVVPLVVNANGVAGSGLLLYDQAAGLGAFYATDGQGNLILLSEDATWPDSWTHIVAGHFTDSDFSDLLFYDQSNGVGALYTTNGSGGMDPVAEYHDWRTSWTHIFVQRFRFRGGVSHAGDPVEGRHDVLFYEGFSGYSEIYEVDQVGGLNLIGARDLDPGLPIIVGGSFGGGFASLLAYDQGAGRGLVFDLQEIAPTDDGYTENNKVNIVDGERFEGWPTTWDVVVAGNFWVLVEGDLQFADGGFTDLLFYDRDLGYGEFYLHEPPDSTVVRPLEGYCSARSVRPGETISFFVSSQVGPYTIKVYRHSADDVFMADVLGLPKAPSPLSIGRTAWRDGAQWPPAGSLQIPLDWPSGLYVGRVEAAPAPPADIPFIVRAAVDGSQAATLVVMNDTTYEAYNYWGGRSLYGFGSHGSMVWTSPGSGAANLPWAWHVSFRRPVNAVFPEHQQKWAYSEVPFVRWLARQGIEVEWCTLVDLHGEANLLDHYRLLVNVGHAEYVSKEMRDRIVAFVRQGGNAAFFTGNTCWWRVRIEDDGQALVCYKDGRFDPIFDPAGDPTTDASTVTVNWPDNLAAGLTGVVWSRLVLLFKPEDDAGRARLQYVVKDEGHWVFADTGLHTSEPFGVYDDGKQTVVGGETDVRPESSPDGFTTLAEVKDGDSPVATMGIFSRGGTVFTASTIYWTRGLSQDAGRWGPIDQITGNVLERLCPEWGHRDLTIVTGAPAAAGDPAGYTWNIDSTQHVVYRGTDGHIHELWYDGTWNGADLTTATGAPAAAGDPAGYTWNIDSTQHVVYRGTDGHIHELWYDGTWNGADLTTATGAPAAAGDPAGYTWNIDSTQHVVYRGTDGHIHELWYDGTWNGADLTTATGAPAAAGDPAGYTWNIDSTQHVVYRGTDGHIHELWYDGTWNGADLTTATGAPAAAGDPAGYTWNIDSTQHVVYRGTDGHIHELWYDGTWNGADLTTATGAPDAAGDPAGYTWNIDSTQHVVYRGTDGHIHELWYDGTWNHADLTEVSLAPTAVGDPSGYACESRGTQHVVFRGMARPHEAGGHIHELRWGLG